MKKYFRLFACCIPVKGARRSIICDLQRQSYRFIPNGMYEILTKHQTKTINEIKEIYLSRFDKVIDEYFNFMLTEEYGFWTEDPTRFPDLDTKWERPEKITNAILDIDGYSTHNYHNILKQLDELGCKAIQIRIYDVLKLKKLSQILDLTQSSRLRAIDILFKYSPELSFKALEKLCLKYTRISNIYVHSSPVSEQKTIENLDVLIHFRVEPVTSAASCGEVHPGYFVVNTELFTESNNFNTCLNCKISIDVNGEIKNCPSSERSFGNVSQIPMQEVLQLHDFAKLWGINKDQVEVCKDCEFRHICTDCRVYIQDKQNIYSKPSKCNYDPYIAQWK